VTFHLVCLGWVLFRAGDVATAVDVLSGLVLPRRVLGPFPVGALLVVALGLLTQLLALRVEPARVWARVPRPIRGVGFAIVAILVGLFSAQSGRFIYFQF
jgi:hypothetical protein